MPYTRHYGAHKAINQRVESQRAGEIVGGDWRSSVTFKRQRMLELGT
jgi:hypothetical protein